MFEEVADPPRMTFCVTEWEIARGDIFYLI